VTLVLGLVGPLRSQQPAAPAPQAAEPESAAVSPIDQILEADEDVLQGEGYNYDAGSRRDPFKSLLIGQERPELKGPRPAGIPGLLIDELTLSGIFRTARGLVAQVQVSAKEKSYLLRAGDQLYDGDVVRIGDNEVVFKQIVSDPTALKPFREVVKKLKP
jgi:Tfp pilus assembly protein PilP